MRGKKSGAAKRETAVGVHGAGAGADAEGEARLGAGPKRSGVEAVKLHLEATNHTGRTSRSATAVRKTSNRMTAIKEYPFDLSDLKDGAPPPPTANTLAVPGAQPAPAPAPPAPAAPRRVSILTDNGKGGYENHAYDRNRKVSGQAEGPVRRKSNLHNAYHADMDNSWDKSSAAGAPYGARYNKKFSTASSNQSKRTHVQSDGLESSWWFACCQKFHQDDSAVPSWEPPKWQKICPYPLCPTYRQFAQTFSLFIIGILAWVVLWCMVGHLAEPGGVLFTLAVLALAAHFGGWLMVKITTLPALIGMLLVGMALRNFGLVHMENDFSKISSFIRKFALTIILTRAGLDLDPTAMKKLFLTVLKLGLVPWIAECCIVAVMTHYLLDLPWYWAFLLGSVIAAVSPAVVVPCLFRLRARGYGVAKGIPTLVLAVSGIDDAASVAVFGIISSLMFSNSSLTMNIIQGPLSVIGGVGFGVACGYLVRYVPERNDPFLVPLRVLLLLVGGLVSVLGSEEIGWGGAGPLAVIAFSFMAMKNWTDMGWDVEDNPVATAFEIFWMLFEPLLFSITGAGVVFSELEPHLVLVGGGCLVTGVVLRIFVTAGIGFRSNLNTKEKFFVGLSWMAKATVQAALGPVALDEVGKMAGLTTESPEPRYAQIVLTVCIMSIVLTAPLGAIIITLAGPRLLTKTTKPQVLEGWRRSHRPSMRDISIIDEEELAERVEDAESAPAAPAAPAPSPAAVAPAPPPADNPAAITVQPNHRA